MINYKNKYMKYKSKFLKNKYNILICGGIINIKN